MRLHITCPNCGSAAYGFRKRQLSELVTEVAYECREPTCRGTFVFQGEVSRWLNVPNNLNPRLNVPLSPVVQRRQLQDAIDNLRTADLGPEGEMFAEPPGQLDIFTQGAAAPP